MTASLSTSIDAWRADDYALETERRDSVVLKATDAQGHIIGFILGRLVPGQRSDFDADLYNIAVLEPFQRRGCGAALLDEFLKLLSQSAVNDVWLEVRESNTKAIAFYQLHGFDPEITRPSFYSNPTENALIMHLSLNAFSQDHKRVNKA